MGFTVDDFLAAKMIGAPHTGTRSASASTLATYRHTLEKAERVVGKPLAEFTEDDAMTLLTALHGQSPRTRNKDVVIVRQAFEWAFRTRRYDGANPFAGVRQAKVEDSLPRAISLADADAIIAALADVCPQETLEKYQIAFTLQATSGLRIGEVVKLRVGDVRPDGLVVRGKGSKQRFVPIRPDVMERLRQYCEGRDASQPVFVSQSWQSTSTAPMAIGTFTRMFKRAVTAAGYNPDTITPHVLRHSFATHALRQTGRLEVVQDLLGHADPKTTRIYARLAADDLQQAYERLW